MRNLGETYCRITRLPIYWATLGYSASWLSGLEEFRWPPSNACHLRAPPLVLISKIVSLTWVFMESKCQSKSCKASYNILFFLRFWKFLYVRLHVHHSPSSLFPFCSPSLIHSLSFNCCYYMYIHLYVCTYMFI